MQARFSSSQIDTFQYLRSWAPKFVIAPPLERHLTLQAKAGCAQSLLFPQSGSDPQVSRQHPTSSELINGVWKGGGRKAGKKVGRRRRRKRGRRREAKPGEFLSDSVVFRSTQEGRLCVFSELCLGQREVKDALYLHPPREPGLYLLYKWKKKLFSSKKR